jgi:hypothetical protein
LKSGDLLLKIVTTEERTAVVEFPIIEVIIYTTL